MQRNTAPFRADTVGSFLRPAAIKQAREQFASGTLSAEQLHLNKLETVAIAVPFQVLVPNGHSIRWQWHSGRGGLLPLTKDVDGTVEEHCQMPFNE